jgi:hypothetical protein
MRLASRRLFFYLPGREKKLTKRLQALGCELEKAAEVRIDREVMDHSKTGNGIEPNLVWERLELSRKIPPVGM